MRRRCRRDGGPQRRQSRDLRRQRLCRRRRLGGGEEATTGQGRRVGPGENQIPVKVPEIC